MRTGFLLCAALLTACASRNPQAVNLPDGTRGFTVDCSTSRKTWANCMNEAAAACDGPYEIVSRDQSSPGAVAAGTTIISAIRRTMIVKCK